VFHHIAPGDRAYAVRSLRRALRPGGLCSIWENNPWSLPARYVMSRCAFDADAQMVTAHEAWRLLQAAGFEILRIDYIFIFPRWLGALRWCEAFLHRTPLGAQYQVLARLRKIA
jgi:SAM-dependent methyltransferase